MSRARNIKPGFFTNGDLLECQPLARLLFAGLWCEADRRGILEDRPKTLKVKLLPGDNCDVDELLNELEAKGFIQRYQVDGVRCISVLNFGKHQNPHVKETPNALPAPCKPGASPVQAHGKNEASPADSGFLIPDSSSPPMAPLPGADADSGAGPMDDDHTDAPEPDDSTDPIDGGEEKPKRKRRIPETWLPTERIYAWGMDEYGLGPPEIDRIAKGFVNYWLSTGGTKLDWDRTFMVWVGKEMERKVSGPIRSIGSRASPNGAHLPPHLQQRVDRWVIERQTLKLPIEPYPDALLADIEAWKASRLVGATL